MAIDVQTVLDAFEPALFIPKLRSKDRESILLEMVEEIEQRGVIRDRDLVAEMLRTRERLGSTGIGHGVAVPHGRSLAVPRLIAAFGRHAKGVEWEAIDGAPVRFVFLVLAPPLDQSNRYLPFLGRIVEAVSDDAQRDKLAAVESYEEFQESIRDSLA